jgi:hypothetical protein
MASRAFELKESPLERTRPGLASIQSSRQEAAILEAKLMMLGVQVDESSA